VWGSGFGPGVHAKAPEGFVVGKPLHWQMLTETGGIGTCVVGVFGVVERNKELRADFTHPGPPDMPATAAAAAEKLQAFSERYVLTALDDGRSTRLDISCGPMPLLEASMVQPGWPIALQAVKALAEGTPADDVEVACPESPMQTEQPALRTVAVATKVRSMSELPQAMGKAMGELKTALAAANLSPSGSCLISHFLSEPGPAFAAGREVEIRVCRPLPEGVSVPSGSGPLLESIIPACKVARMWYTGPFEGLPSAWGRLDAYLQREKLSKAADGWFFESYLRGHEETSNPKRFITQLSRPIQQ